MGVDDEHGPVVGDDFVYSTGLTSAGAFFFCFLRRGRGRRRASESTPPSLARPQLPSSFAPSRPLTPGTPLPSHHTTAEAEKLLEVHGRNELEEKKTPK
jgi:hypothetical protein